MFKNTKAPQAICYNPPLVWDKPLEEPAYCETLLLLDKTVHVSVRSLTHWGWVTHICISKLNIIGSDNGLSPGRRQAIIWTSAGILLTSPLGSNFSEMLLQIQTFAF